MKIADDDRLYIEDEAAHLLKLKKPTLRRWRWAGIGPEYIQLGKRAIRYPGYALNAFAASGCRRSTSDDGVAR